MTQRSMAREVLRGAHIGSTLLVLVSACSLLTPDDLTSDSATGTEAGMPESDVTSDSAAVTETRGPSDDGGVASDAHPGGDGGVPSDAGRSPFCASQSPASTFCVDFDEHPVEFDWTNVFKGGVLALDDAFAVSEPNCARVALPDAGNCLTVGFERSFPNTPKGLHLEFSIRTGNAMPDAGSLAAYVGFVDHKNADGGDGCKELFHVGTTSMGVETQYAGSNGVVNDPHPFSRYALPGVWTRVEFDMIAQAGVPEISVKLDGVSVLDPTPIPQCGLGGSSELYLGLYCSYGPGEVRYDNIRVDVP
jgi:hypothetical protein